MNLEIAQNFVDGGCRPAISEQNMPIYEPTTGEIYGAIADSAAADVDLAVKAARKAFDSALGGAPRRSNEGRMLTRLRDLMLKHAAELSALEDRRWARSLNLAMSLRRRFIWQKPTS